MALIQSPGSVGGDPVSIYLIQSNVCGVDSSLEDRSEKYIWFETGFTQQLTSPLCLSPSLLR
jgi:hypothetical protein